MYRHEFKYLIDYYQFEIIKTRLSAILKYDLHAGTNEFYEIRSLYFDNWDNSCFYDNENGTDPREKFRIRIYNGTNDRIRLELKRKEAGKTLKTSCSMDLSQVKSLLEGKGIMWDDDMPALMKKLYIQQETMGLSPKTIVEYDRVPFICKEGNVRITLDMDVRGSDEIDKFLDKKIDCRPVMPLYHNILEVKYDQFLPDYIKDVIQMKGLQQTAYSKYYICRKYGGVL